MQHCALPLSSQIAEINVHMMDFSVSSSSSLIAINPEYILMVYPPCITLGYKMGFCWREKGSRNDAQILRNAMNVSFQKALKTRFGRN